MQELCQILRNTRYLLPHDNDGQIFGIITRETELMRLEMRLSNIICINSEMESMLEKIKSIYALLPRIDGKIYGAITSNEIDQILLACQIPKRYSALGVGQYDLALDRAIRANDLKSVQKLLDLGADIDGYGTGISHISIAIEAENFEIVKFLLKNGVNPNKRYRSQTPLQQASDRGIIGIYRILKHYNAEL